MFVSNVEELLVNIETFNKYIDDDHLFFKNLLSAGKCYVVCNTNGVISFSPSRFIGYKENNKEKHFTNDLKNGMYTNDNIGKLLGKDVVNPVLEKIFRDYCTINGVTPHLKERRYWYIKVPISENILIEDITDISLIDSKTDREVLSLARIGQGKYRENLIKYWGGCAITNCKTLVLLRASHIKPWRSCNNFERLDPFNGLLLIPNLDLLFNDGYITFDSNGRIMISNKLEVDNYGLFNLNKEIIIKIEDNHQKYLEYHRVIEFKDA